MLNMEEVNASLMDDIETRVRRGARALDAAKPTWYTRINLDTLDISDSTLCILGQVYGDYSTGLETLFGVQPRLHHIQWVRRSLVHGFAPPPMDTERAVEAAWKKEIRARRGN